MDFIMTFMIGVKAKGQVQDGVYDEFYNTC